MVDRRGKNEESKKNLAKGKKFSKEYQPTPEAKSLAKQKKKTMREMLDYLMEKNIKDKSTGNEVSTLEAMSISLISKALKGDVRAYEVIRDTVGQKLTDRTEITLNQGLEFDMDVIKRINQKLDEE